MKLEMMDDRLLVEQTEEEEEKTTPGGIVVPNTAKDKPTTGVVLAVGPGSVTESGERRPIGLNVGDHVLYGRYAGSTLEFENEEYLMLRESDVIARVKDG